MSKNVQKFSQFNFKIQAISGSITTVSPIASCRPTCDLDHGNCVDGQCRCHNGWTGAACDQRQCPERCKEHGSCVRGMCVCDAGWNGNLCTFGRYQVVTVAEPAYWIRLNEKQTLVFVQFVVELYKNFFGLTFYTLSAKHSCFCSKLLS